MRRTAMLLRKTLSAGPVWLIALSFGMYSMQWMAVIGFLPSIYAQAGLAATTVGILTAIASMVNIIGNIGSGRLLYRGIPASGLLTTAFFAMAIGTWLAFSSATEGLPLVRYLGVILFSSVGGMIPSVLFSLVVALAPDEECISTTAGWVQQLSALGQFSGPPLVAWIATRYGGWHLVWVVLMGASAMGLLLARASASRGR